MPVNCALNVNHDFDQLYDDVFSDSIHLAFSLRSYRKCAWSGVVLPTLRMGSNGHETFTMVGLLFRHFGTYHMVASTYVMDVEISRIHSGQSRASNLCSDVPMVRPTCSGRHRNAGAVLWLEPVIDFGTQIQSTKKSKGSGRVGESRRETLRCQRLTSTGAGLFDVFFDRWIGEVGGDRNCKWNTE